MMEKSKRVGFVGFVMAVMLGATMFMPSFEATAKTETVAIEGISYNVGFSFHDNLKSLTGKKVYVTLDSGKTFAGTIKAVGDHLLHLEKLDGKSYFDALIRIENINAIDTKFRDVQR